MHPSNLTTQAQRGPRTHRKASRPEAATATHRPGSEALRGADRLAALLNEPGARGCLAGERLLVQAPRKGVTLQVGSAPAEAAAMLVSDGAAVWSGTGQSARLSLTEHGRRRVVRASDAEEGFRLQHRQLERQEGDRPAVNLLESPLLWLHRRRGRDGEPLIDAAAFAAGERLRADLEAGRMLGKITTDWSRLGAATDGGGGGDLTLSEAIVAARARASRALAAVGGDFSGLLLDLCGYLKGLDQIERERQWPARSAKIVVRLALAALARHYGLQTEASGPLASRGIRTWTVA